MVYGGIIHLNVVSRKTSQHFIQVGRHEESLDKKIAIPDRYVDICVKRKREENDRADVL